ncbi:MAG TPA: hypothetical protein VLF18_02790 [Tahibacter sp.]|uniref:hypothetical protein n=1 Tax=Tahibacter sp. TaxID=2056211 RepID=UPI002CD4C12C|nr:hypothetical protein [Tahibacter sp.]HSX59105.1 hypothetical protein [Tahibacter sp.]
MQRICSSLRRRLGAAAFAVTLLFAGSAQAGSEEPTNVIDDSVSTTGQYYAILCNTCSTADDFINKAVTQYPRVRQSAAYVYNLATGQIRTIVLDWDPETLVQMGGYEDVTDARLVTYVSQAGDLYRRNGNSLAFTGVVRADGSVYLKLPNGTKVELRVASSRTVPGNLGPRSVGTIATDPTPGAGSPIDLRGYTFGSYFSNLYPNFPESSYDLAFGDQPGSIDGFVHDYFSTLGTSPGQVFDPESLRFVSGAHKLTEQVTGNVSLFVPMKDGGYARVRYDTATGDVMLRQIVDPSGVVLPNGYGNPLAFYGDRSWNLGGNAQWAVGAFEEWAARNGIDVLVLNSGWGTGGRVTCMSRSINEVTCTIHPN